MSLHNFANFLHSGKLCLLQHTATQDTVWTPCWRRHGRLVHQQQRRVDCATPPQANRAQGYWILAVLSTRSHWRRVMFIYTHYAHENPLPIKGQCVFLKKNKMLNLFSFCLPGGAGGQIFHSHRRNEEGSTRTLLNQVSILLSRWIIMNS